MKLNRDSVKSNMAYEITDTALVCRVMCRSDAHILKNIKNKAFSRPHGQRTDLHFGRSQPVTSVVCETSVSPVVPACPRSSSA